MTTETSKGIWIITDETGDKGIEDIGASYDRYEYHEKRSNAKTHHSHVSAAELKQNLGEFLEVVEETAIALNWVTERLRRCGADNVVLLLDACRNEGSKGGGIGEEQQKGVITIASCSPAERSYEIDEIGQGAFTYALLESLRIQGDGNCATVERLNQRLKYRVAEINRQYRKPRQTPYTIAEPASKYHLILLPKYATLNDIAALKNDAYRAEVQQDWELAKQLWIRVNIAAAGSDLDTIDAIQRFPQWRRQPMPPPPQQPNPTGSRTGASAPTQKPPPPPKPEPEPEEVELLSDKGADYSRLRDLLAAGKWKEADQETAKMMVQVVGREAERWLREEDIERFPCTDLRTIDQLWVRYSNGRFGFSVQKEIYQRLGGTREYDLEIWNTSPAAVVGSFFVVRCCSSGRNNLPARTVPLPGEFPCRALSIHPKAIAFVPARFSSRFPLPPSAIGCNTSQTPIELRDCTRINNPPRLKCGLLKEVY